MEKNKNIAVIGCGYWGKNLVRNFHELGSLGAICDGFPETAQRMAEKYDVPALTIDQVLANNHIKGIVVAAPAEKHYQLAKEGLRAGKHVYVEKPLALQMDHAEELCQLAQRENRILMVGHLLQYHAAFLKLKEMVKSGQLGKIQYIYSNRLNFGKIRDEENILWSFAPHDISMILGLAGDNPESVYATGAAHLNSHIQDVTTTHLKFKSGLEAHIFVSWLHPFKEQKLVVVGEKGMAVFDDGQPWSGKLAYYPHKVTWINGLPTPEKAEKEYIPLQESEPLKTECAHFIECINRGKNPTTDGIEGLNVLSTLNAAQKSLDTGKSISLASSSIENPYFVHDSSYVDDNVSIGSSTKIWHFSHILGNSKIGQNCVIGQNVVIGPDITVGNNCKVQNNVSLYKGVTLEDGVFCGPSCVFTNVNNPRAEIERKDEFRETYVEKGVTIGANATIVCGVTLGAYSFIGAGAVVTKDVPKHALMVGNPARQVGWMSEAGGKLSEDFICPLTSKKYKVEKDQLLETDGS